MNDLHLVSPNDELSMRNGSAILTVARSLQRAAIARGRQSWVGGAADRIGDLGNVVGVYSAVPRGSRVRSLFDRAAKYLWGRTVSGLRIVAPPIETDRVIAHNLPWLGRALRATFPRVRLVLYVHNQVMVGARPTVIRARLRDFDTVVCVSDFIRRDLMARARLSLDEASHVVAVTNGVDSERFEQVQSSGPSFDVGFIGRIVPQKGVLEFARACREVAAHKRTERLRVLLVGGESFLPRQESQYELDVKDALQHHMIELTSTGPVPPSDIPSYMNRCRVIAVTSTWPDPCPLVVGEALASHAATIASAVGGIPELMADAGLDTFSHDQPGQLGQQMLRLLRDEAAFTDNVDAGRRWAIRHTWEQVLNRVDEACDPL